MKTIKFLKESVKEKKKLYFSVIIFFLLGRTIDLFLPLSFKFIIDYASLYLETKSEEVFSSLMIASFLIVMAALLSRGAYRVFDYLEAKLLPILNAEIPLAIFKYLTNHSNSFFDNNFSGEIVQKIKQINDISKNFLIFYPSQIIGVFIMLLFTSIIIMPKSLLLGVSILCFGAFYAFMSYVIANKNKQLAAEWASKNSRFNGHLVDSVENMIFVKSSAKKDFEIEQINEQAEEEKKILLKLKLGIAKIKIIHTIVSSSVIIFVLFYSLYLYLNKIISLGDFVFNFTIITRITDNFYLLGELMSDMLEKYGTFSSALAFIYKKQDDDSDLPNIQVSGGEIKLENLTFKYTNKYIFNNFNLHIKAKEKVAIVGHSGSGKSTLIKLLMKQYKLESGIISIDNQNIDKFNSESISKNITYVNQDVYLFNRTIRENITYIKPEATEEELMEACKKAGCLDFILLKEKGFETLVGERGVQLSGGEKQRIALARAFLLNKPILILDEPTSALDATSESIIQQSIKELIKDKTVIIIAHRLATIKNMDRLIVMEKGSVIEDGEHEELLNTGGKYQELWNNQMY